MKINQKALGLSLGVVWGGCVFITTWISYLTGYGEEFLGLVQSIYPGYSITPLGSVVGLVYGFVDLFVCGYIVGWIYNKLAQ